MNQYQSIYSNDHTLVADKAAKGSLRFIWPLSLSFLLSFLVFSSHAQDADEQAATGESAPATSQTSKSPIQQIDNIANDISSLMLDDQYKLIDVTLDAGGEHEQAHQFPVFIAESKKALSMGTFYLLSDVAYNGAQLHDLISLAEQMSVLGWHAVVMPAPQLMLVMAEVDAKKAAAEAKQALSEQPAEAETDQPADEPPESPTDDPAQGAEQASTDASSTEQSTQTETSAVPSNIQTKVAARFHQSAYDEVYQQAFNSYLQTFFMATIDATEQSGYKVVFAQGMSAQALLAMDNTAIIPDAIIINNMYWPERQINQSLPLKMASYSAPLLDLISKEDNQWASATAQARKIKASVEIKTHYRQREVGLFGINTDIAADMAKEIYGWLTYLGW